jgi:hypothetical protein
MAGRTVLGARTLERYLHLHYPEWNYMQALFEQMKWLEQVYRGVVEALCCW